MTTLDVGCWTLEVGKLLVHIKDDLKRFQTLAADKGHNVCVMGYATVWRMRLHLVVAALTLAMMACTTGTLTELPVCRYICVRDTGMRND